MALEVGKRLGQGDGVPAGRDRQIITGVFAFLPDAPAQPPRARVEEQQRLGNALEAIP